VTVESERSEIGMHAEMRKRGILFEFSWEIH
jgi:hypothetical protein